MNITALYGSPRKKGNSAEITNRFLATAESLGATTKSFYLNSLDIKGCQACMGCKTKKDHCIVKDDLAPVLEAVRESDVLVLASPVYFGDITAQMKMFIDRTYSYFVPDFLTNPKPSRLSSGKKLVFVQTQGQSAEALFNDIYPKYQMFLNMMGFTDTRLIRACGFRDAGSVTESAEIMKQAEDAARQVMG